MDDGAMGAEGKVACPVCTLYLHEGMSLDVHLDTHPKDQVIRALCALSSGNRASFGELSFRSEEGNANPNANGNGNGNGNRAPSRTPSRFSDASRCSSRASCGTPNARRRSRSPFVKRCGDCRECGNCGCGRTPPPVYPSVSVQVSDPFRPPTSSVAPVQVQAPVPIPVPVQVPVPMTVPVPTAATEALPVGFARAFDAGPKKIAALAPEAFGAPPQIVYRRIVDGTEPKAYFARPEGASFRSVMVLQPYPKACFVPQPRPIFPRSEENRTLFDSIDVPKILSFDGAPTETRPAIDPVIVPPAPQSQNKVFANDPPEIVRTVDKKSTSETSSRLRGLKILSDVKIEPSTISDVIDLTLRSKPSNDRSIFHASTSSLTSDESIYLDVDDSSCNSYARNRFPDAYADGHRTNSTLPMKDAVDEEISAFDAIPNASSNTFSVIKNIGNPATFKPTPPFANDERSRSEMDLIVPDITCTEKPRAGFGGEINDAGSTKPPQIEISVNEVFGDASTTEENVAVNVALNKVPKKKNVYSRKPKKTLIIKNMKDKVKTWIELDNLNKPSSSAMCEVVVEKKTTVTEESKNSIVTDLEIISNSNISKSKFLNNFLAQKEFKLEDNLNEKNNINSEGILDGQIFTDLPQNDRSNFMCDKNTTLENAINNLPDIDKFFLSKVGCKKSNDDSEAVRPVNVIAFGSIATSSEISKLDMFTPFTDISKNIPTTSINNKVDEHSKEITSILSASNTNDNSYSISCSQEKFSNENDVDIDNDIENNSDASDNEITEEIHKIELPSIDEIPNENDQYLWNDSAQKEEFPFGNLIQYNQSFPKIDSCADDRDQLTAIDKDYTELLCPRDNYSTHEDKSSFFSTLGKDKCTISNSDALNIRTDEQMPSRGELSEQESSGDVDAPWAGMYRDSATFSDVVGSTSYDFLAHDTWPSDTSDNEIPDSPRKTLYTQVNDAENMPIVVSVKPPEKKYKCATCYKSFNCPKERRVHKSKEHAISSTVRKVVKKSCFIPIESSMKKEDSIKIESITPTATSNSSLLSAASNLEDSTRIDIKPVKTEFVNCKELDAIVNKPPLAFVKIELEKKKSDLTCPTCKAEFPNVFKFNEHLKIHPLECLTCGKLFQRRTNLHLHLKRHYGIKDFKCAVCDKQFITKQKMIEHYNIHTGKMPIKCSLCDLYFRRHSNMVQHRNRHHLQLKKKLRDYICTCGEVFHSKKKLAWHKEIHDDKPKCCLHCNEKFIHMTSLTRHIRRTHNNYFVPDEKRKDENVQCAECNNVYLKSSIEMHMKTHSGSKPYSCVICNKSFTTKWNLKLHKWTHANRSTKPFKCNLCKSAFIRQVDYVSHMNSHKSVRPYTCNYCGCQFIRKYNCQRHVKEHENEKKYVCEVPDCGKTFHRSYYLTEHLKVHSGVRPFSCNICGKTSSTKSNHNKHVKIHHAREPVTTEG